MYNNENDFEDLLAAEASVECAYGLCPVFDRSPVGRSFCKTSDPKPGKQDSDREREREASNGNVI